MRFIRPRLCAPVSVAVLGTVAAVAQGWASAIIVVPAFAATNAFSQRIETDPTR
jgi:hypothetical protein